MFYEKKLYQTIAQIIGLTLILVALAGCGTSTADLSGVD